MTPHDPDRLDLYIPEAWQLTRALNKLSHHAGLASGDVKYAAESRSRKHGGDFLHSKSS